MIRTSSIHLFLMNFLPTLRLCHLCITSPPETFVTRVKTAAQRTEDDEYAEGSEAGYSESSAHTADGAASPPTSASNVPYAGARQPAPAPSTNPPAALVPDLMGDLLAWIIVLWSLLTSFYSASPPLPVLLPAATGQGLQISAQLTGQGGQIFYSILFENNSQIPLDGFMIQFNKNSFVLQLLDLCRFPNCYQGHRATLCHGFVSEYVCWSSKLTFASCREKIINNLYGISMTKSQCMYSSQKMGGWNVEAFLRHGGPFLDSNEVSKDFPALQ
uniref:Clathrin adaptor alpha/beta/gamma-adaptin appendage Ig-like subdomain domain-containing protein n=1 Tax=Salix viminalis TaxID=40686 RepID=A0A6N2MBZ4_SALVM